MRFQKTSSSSSSSSCPTNLLTLSLLLLVIVQWCLLSYMIAVQEKETSVDSHTLVEAAVPPQIVNNEAPKGVFVTVLFRAPRWFLLRYTYMIHNALTQLPTDWKMQIFINHDWFRKEVLPYHPALPELLQNNPRIQLTSLPDRLLPPKNNKPKLIMVDRWFWEQILSDQVIFFSGNGAFCANHVHLDDQGHNVFLLDRLQDFDFCGPKGDASTHSYRNRATMLRILHAVTNNTHPYPLSVSQGTTSETHFFLNAMQQLNKQQEAINDNNNKPFRICSNDDAFLFGGVTNLTSTHPDGSEHLTHLPWVVSGTQTRLTWDERDSLLKHCPEVKAIFPSLHEPGCFGAHPDPVTCKQSICALQDEGIPKGGC